MGPLNLQNVRAVLDELEDDPEYWAFADAGVDEWFNVFRQQVEITGVRCLQVVPDQASPEEIEGRLKRLGALCAGSLARFKPFIERAQAALHTA
jgi:hypothetical protein